MKNTKSIRWAIWAFAAFFYFYEYLLRVSPNVMVPELMMAFDVNAAQLGILIASFLAVYAPMQLPVGILMDRYGARRLLMFASLGCGIGAFFFALAKTMSLAFAGRIIIGISASFAFVGMVYVCSHWFEKNKRASLVGLANSISMLGAFAGGGPLSLMIVKMGWRVSLFFWAFVGVVLALLIFIFVRKDSDQGLPKAQTHETPNSLFEGIKIFCKSFFSWINALIALLYYTITTAIGGLWGVPFIQMAYQVQKETASFAVSMIFIGWLVGSPLMGFLSDRIGNRKVMISIGTLGTFLSFAPILYLTKMPIFYVYILIFLTGFFSSAQLLNFTYATEINPGRVKGASIAVTNFIVAIGGMIVQPLIGFLLDFHHKQAVGMQTSKNIYSQSDYRFALTLLPICILAAWFLTFFLKESHRNREEER